VTTWSRCPHTILHLPTSKKGDVLIATERKQKEKAKNETIGIGII
jgi:hypothetical protein